LETKPKWRPVAVAARAVRQYERMPEHLLDDVDAVDVREIFHRESA
jgi:hypothetical protein